MSDATAADLWAVLPLDGRGALVFEQLHEQPLYLIAAARLAEIVPWAVLRAEPEDVDRVRAELARARLSLRVVTPAAWWAEIRAGAPRTILVHDPLCPLTPGDLVSRVLGRAMADPRGELSVAAVRPVTDTVKTATQHRIIGTIDRSGLVAVTSPVVIASTVLERAIAACDEPPITELASLVCWLRERGDVQTVQAPSLGRRVDDVLSVQLLECMDELSHQLREARLKP